jgi:hypothetical protein
MSQAPKSMAPTFPFSVVNFLDDQVRKPLIPIDVVLETDWSAVGRFG